MTLFRGDKPMRLISALLFVSSAVLALGAAAQTRIFCCDDAKGRKVCGDFLPTECQGRAYEERDNRGFVSKTVEAPLTVEQQARRDAEQARKEDEKKKAGEERRRTLALLSTYSGEKDIDHARDRSLAEIDKNMKESQQRLEEARKNKLKLDSDKEFYKGKPVPEQVKSQIRDNEKEIKAQQAAVDSKTKEMADVRSRFAEEKRRYLELTGKKATEATPAAPAAESKPGDKPAAAPEPAPAPAKPATEKK
jgi:hypothetical protein